jgi:hypothetical protein
LFNVTLLITGSFALAAGEAPNYVVLSSLVALWSVGVGGNLPVDFVMGSFNLRLSVDGNKLIERNIIFFVGVEFISAIHQYLLTVLSI